MENHLRLAERQGLLQGQSLSPVRVFALRLLIYSDAKARERAEIDTVKAAMIASGSRTVEDLHPAWFGEPEEVVLVDELDPSGELPENANYEAVEWLSPKDGEAFEELLKLHQELMDGRVTVGGGQVWDNETYEGGWV